MTPESHRDYYHCRYCGCKFATNYHPARPPANAPTNQHILPTRRGGDDTLQNLRPCCQQCNLQLEAADDCPAALACAVAIVGGNDEIIKRLARSWPRGVTVIGAE